MEGAREQRERCGSWKTPADEGSRDTFYARALPRVGDVREERRGNDDLDSTDCRARVRDAPPMRERCECRMCAHVVAPSALGSRSAVRAEPVRPAR